MAAIFLIEQFRHARGHARVEHGHGPVVQRHQPFLPALAEYPHHPALQIKVQGTQPDEFGHAQPGRVQQFQHGAVTAAQFVARVRGVQESGRFFPGQHVGQQRGQLGTIQQRGRIAVGQALFDGPGEKTAQAGQATSQRAATVAPTTQPDYEQQQSLVVQSGQGRSGTASGRERRVPFIQKSAQGLQILTIGGHRMR